jgi:hypothetical protein
MGSGVKDLNWGRRRTEPDPYRGPLGLDDDCVAAGAYRLAQREPDCLVLPINRWVRVPDTDVWVMHRATDPIGALRYRVGEQPPE